MNVKKAVENGFRRNTYAADWLYRHYHPEREEFISKTVRDFSQTDSLRDTEPLKRFKERIVNEKIPFWSYDVNKTESRMYGIHDSLFGSISDREIFFPSAEHGLIFHNKNWSDTQNTVRASCVTFGKFRKEVLEKFYSTPIFCVGPYIHYAEDYYDEETFSRIKERLGKNLLVFPTHGTDDAKITYSEKCFSAKIDELRKAYDSVTVCVYWWNLDDPIINKFKEKGYHIVSAGYREDPKFLSRLKAIIDLCDQSIGDGIGTNIGYCLSRGKPFAYFDSETEKEDFNQTDNEDRLFVKKHMDILKDVFREAYFIKERQLEAADYYWGLNQIKTREELYGIYSINKKITVACRGNAGKYAEYARKLLNDKTALEDIEYKLLQEGMKNADTV